MPGVTFSATRLARVSRLKAENRTDESGINASVREAENNVRKLRLAVQGGLKKESKIWGVLARDRQEDLLSDRGTDSQP